MVPRIIFAVFLIGLSVLAPALGQDSSVKAKAAADRVGGPYYPWAVQVDTTNRNAPNVDTSIVTHPVVPVTAPSAVGQNAGTYQLPPVYSDFNAFREAEQAGRPVGIVRKWELGVKVRNAGSNRSGVGGGAFIISVKPGTPAEKAGLLAGDVIVSVDKTMVENASEFMYLLNSSGGQVLLSFRRKNVAMVTSSLLMKLSPSSFTGQHGTVR